MNARLVEIEGRRAILASCRDITVIKRAYEALNRYRNELETLLRQRTAELRENERSLP